MLQTSTESRKDRTVKVLEIEKRMLDTMHSRSSSGLVTKTALLVSGVAALTGALVSSTILVSASAVGGVISLGSTLIHCGYCDADTSVKEDAARLLNAVDRAEAC